MHNTKTSTTYTQRAAQTTGDMWGMTTAEHN